MPVRLQVLLCGVYRTVCCRHAGIPLTAQLDRLVDLHGGHTSFPARAFHEKRQFRVGSCARLNAYTFDGVDFGACHGKLWMACQRDADSLLQRRRWCALGVNRCCAQDWGSDRSRTLG